MDVYRKAKGFLENKDMDSSFKFFTEFINSQLSSGASVITEELADSYNSRGHIRYLWVEFDDAISDYSAAIELDSTFAVSYYNRGQVHYRLGINFAMPLRGKSPIP